MPPCACKGKKNAKYVWTDGTYTVVYNTEIESKAKVLRKGGTYYKVEDGQPLPDTTQ